LRLRGGKAAGIPVRRAECVSSQSLNKAGFAGAVNLKPGIQGWATEVLPSNMAKADRPEA